MRMMNRHLQRWSGLPSPFNRSCIRLPAGAVFPKAAPAGNPFADRRRAVRGGPVPAGSSISGLGSHASPATLSWRASVPDEDARMSKTLYPYLTATLGDAALHLPLELAQPLEAAFAAANEAPAPINLPGCLQRIQAGDAADGQPWPGPASTPGDTVAAARRDRAAVGLVSLLELYHAAERVRVDGEEKDDIGDGTREGLMLACRGLAEYVALQVQGAQ